MKGLLTPAAPAAASVGVASASAVAANVNRSGLVLVNTSTNWIYLGLGATAVVGSGIAIGPAGGAFVMDEATFYKGAIFAIASGADSNLAIQQFI